MQALTKSLHFLDGAIRPLAWAGGACLLVTVLGGCPRGDVGAPCNHGDVEPPESKLVTFPALSCNDLLCVYADEEEAPEITCSPGGNDCNEQSGNPAARKFECVQSGTGAGRCQLSMDYVLSRSMCSKKCEGDGDCKDQGPTKRALAKDSACNGKFKCARIQALGEFCCQKLCVCEDDLGVTTDLDEHCTAGNQPGCCVDEFGTAITPVPEGCGGS